MKYCNWLLGMLWNHLRRAFGMWYLATHFGWEVCLCVWNISRAGDKMSSYLSPSCQNVSWLLKTHRLHSSAYSQCSQVVQLAAVNHSTVQDSSVKHKIQAQFYIYVSPGEYKWASKFSKCLLGILAHSLHWIHWPQLISLFIWATYWDIYKWLSEFMINYSKKKKDLGSSPGSFPI